MEIHGFSFFLRNSRKLSVFFPGHSISRLITGFAGFNGHYTPCLITGTYMVKLLFFTDRKFSFRFKFVSGDSFEM